MFNKSIFLSILLLGAGQAGAYESIEFKSQILNPGFARLSGLALGADKVYALDAKANCVFLFDKDGKYIRKAEAGLKEPQAIAFGEGNFYVADTGNSRVVVFDAEGKPRWSFSGEGSAPGQLSKPKGVAVGPDSRVYVSNTGNSRIEVFNSDGVYLSGFPVLRGDKVTKVSPGKLSVSYSGEIYLSDPALALVQKYDRSGKLLKEYPLPNDGVAPDRHGFLYVISAKEGKVRELSSASGETIGSFGTKGAGKTEFRKLTDVAMGQDGLVYLSDEENKKIAVIAVEGSAGGTALEKAPAVDRFGVKGPVSKFPVKAEVFAVTSSGAVVAWLPETKELSLLEPGSRKTLVKYGSAEGQLKNPKGLFVDEKGRIYAADTDNNRIQVFNPDGTFANGFGRKGSKEGEFQKPSSVVVNNKGAIYIADTGNQQIKAFSPDGMFRFAVGPKLGSFTLSAPVTVRCDENRNVYILDAGLKKVLVTDHMGKFIKAWDDSGSLQEPAALVYDGKGFFYILDRGAFNIKIFDADGKYAASFFAKGRGERELWTPLHLEFSGDRVYLSDPEIARVVSFDISYLPEAPTALAAAAGVEKADLAWKAASNAWSAGFKVYRSESENGERKEAGETADRKFSDKELKGDATYYYYVAGLSASGMRGPLSEPLAVYVQARPAAAAALADSRQSAPVEIIPVQLNYVFSANYKHYLNNPVGRVEIQNNTDTAFNNVKVSFFLKDFMDFPTDSVLPELAPRSKAGLGIMATLNNKVLGITEDTPVQSQMTVTWYQDGAEKTATVNKPIKMLSKNAIVWDKPQRLANFITPKDTPVFAFSRFSLNEKGRLPESDLNDNLVTAAMLWEALGELGLSYLADPVSPYAVLKSSGDQVLDTVQFPRNTMRLKSGDCDDLTALFAALFEASGVRAALLDYPAHISLMFDTGATDAREAGLPEEFMIKYGGTWWVGLEVTMVGRDLYEAVKHAADFYRRSEADVKVIEVRGAWAEFEPVTLPDSSEENYPDKEKFLARVKNSLDALMAARFAYFKEHFGGILASEPDNADAHLNLGILHARYGKAGDAEKHFSSVLEKDPFNAAALNNMGNISFTKKDFEGAEKNYHAAAKSDPFDAEIWLNLARAAVEQGKKADARAYAEKAAKLDPAVKNVGDKLIK